MKQLSLQVEIIAKAPEKSYSRDTWPKNDNYKAIYAEEDDTIYFIDEYSVTSLYQPKRYGLVPAVPMYEGGVSVLLEAIAVMTHNKRMEHNG